MAQPKTTVVTAAAGEAAPHYWITRQGAARPFLDHGFTVRSYGIKRFNEVTNTFSLLQYAFLPFIQKFNTQLEKKIQEERKSGGAAVESSLTDDLTVAAHVGLNKYFLYALTVGAQVACVSFLINQSKSRVAQDIVAKHDSQPRFFSHYVSKLLTAVYLPASWGTSLLGQGATPVELDMHYAKNVTMLAAMEDSIKRNVVLCVSEAAATTIYYSICRLLGRRPPARVDAAATSKAATKTTATAAAGVPPPPSGVTAAQPMVVAPPASDLVLLRGLWLRCVFKILGTGLGGGLLHFAGPGWSFLGELLGPGLVFTLVQRALPEVSDAQLRGMTEATLV